MSGLEPAAATRREDTASLKTSPASCNTRQVLPMVRCEPTCSRYNFCGGKTEKKESSSMCHKSGGGPKTRATIVDKYTCTARRRHVDLIDGHAKPFYIPARPTRHYEPTEKLPRALA